MKSSLFIHGKVFLMKQITIRDIPAEVQKAVKREAERKGLSLNRAFIAVLERAVGGKSREKKKKASTTTWIILPGSGPGRNQPPSRRISGPRGRCIRSNGKKQGDGA